MCPPTDRHRRPSARWRRHGWPGSNMTLTVSRPPIRALALLAVALAALSVLLSCSDDDGDHVVFMAGFQPQASLPFVAVYVAQANGYYEDEGLTVDIQHSPGGAEHVDLLEGGDVDFTTATASGFIGRRSARLANGGELPLKAIALFGQRGDRGYVVNRGSGIEGPADFAGHVVGRTSSAPPPELLAMLASVGLTEDDVTLERVGFNDIDRFLLGEIDVYPVFVNNEPDTLRRQGQDVLVIDPADFGIPTLGLVLLARDETIEDTDLTTRFLRATLRGALYAREHVDEAVEITRTYDPELDVDHQSFLLETELRNAERQDGLGRGTVEQWQALVDLLNEYESLEVPVAVEDLFDGSIVDGLYERNELD
jgi:NitT/TauT family transport system substrate-binding protein